MDLTKKHFLYSVVIFLLALPPSAGAQSRQNNPTAVLPLDADPVQAVLEKISLDSLLLYVKQISGSLPVKLDEGREAWIQSRYRTRADNDTAAQFLMVQARSFGLQPQEQRFGSMGKNIIAEQRGWRFPNQKYIICAHYDDLPADGERAPGADDNASGCAAVLEAARILSRMAFPYTLVYIWFDEEEQGTLGSREYSRLARANGDSILGVLTLDMIGYDANQDGRAEVHVRPVANSVYIAERTFELNSNYGVNLELLLFNPGLTGSDHSPFWTQGYGAVLLIEDTHSDFNRHYHTEHDSLAYFNLDYFHRCSQLALLTITSYVAQAAPLNLQLGSPPDLVDEVAVRSLFTWQAVPQAMRYRVQVALDAEFKQPIMERNDLTKPLWISSGLPHNQALYWRARASNKAGSSEWSRPFLCKTTGLKQQNVILNPGWNLASISLFPQDSSLTLMTKSVAHLGFVKDGRGSIYRSAGQDNDLSHWQTGQSYWLYVSAVDTLSVFGDPIYTVPMQIPLRFGWNAPALLTAGPCSPASALATIAQNLVLAKDGQGRVYWPAYGIDQIKTWQPGEGFQVYLTAADTLSYASDGEVPVQTKAIESPLVHFQSPLSGSFNAILLIRSVDLVQGDEIAVRTSERAIVGAGSAADGYALVCVWGDDPLTENIVEGAREGQPLELSYWSKVRRQEEVFNLTRLQDVLSGEELVAALKFKREAVLSGEGRLRLMAIDDQKEGRLPEAMALDQNYPNPFNASTQIRYRVNETAWVRLQVFNAGGQLVSVLQDGQQPAGEYTAVWQSGESAGGVYFYRLQTDRFEQTKKMLLLR